MRPILLVLILATWAHGARAGEPAQEPVRSPATVLEDLNARFRLRARDANRLQNEDR